MNQEIVVKKLTSEDKQENMRIFSDVLVHDFPEYSQKTKDFIIGKNEKEFNEDVQLPYKILLGAFLENQLVGIVHGMHLEAGVCNLGWLMVDRSHQRKGIGKKLISAFEQVMKERGDHSIHLYSAEWNLPYYKKMGYELVGLYKNSWFGADDYLLNKTIQEPKEENFLV